MHRRSLLVGAVSFLAAPFAVEAQPAGKRWRIGVLSAEPPDVPFTYVLRDGLRDLGYIEGQNIAIEWRFAHGAVERLPSLAAEMVRLNVQVIVASNNPAVAAARRATQAIPIVMVFPSDPVGVGFVASLAQPGGNVTGLSLQSRDIAGKRLQLLREAVPNASTFAGLWVPSEPGRRDQARETEVAARALGVRLLLLEMRSSSELDNAFGTTIRDGAAAVVIVGAPCSSRTEPESASSRQGVVYRQCARRGSG